MFQIRDLLLSDNNSAMKIGTDAVLLGAWSISKKYKHILDIGAGCGIVSLLILYHNKLAKATLVEIDKPSVEDITNNIKSNNLHDRCKVINADIRSVRFTNKFDLIISNPPFYINQDISMYNRRKTARIESTKNGLDLKSLFDCASNYLSYKGHLMIITPINRLSDIRVLAAFKKMKINEIVYIRSFEHSKIIRTITTLSYIDIKDDYTNTETINFIIRNRDFSFHYDYNNLIKKLTSVSDL